MKKAIKCLAIILTVITTITTSYSLAVAHSLTPWANYYTPAKSTQDIAFTISNWRHVDTNTVYYYWESTSLKNTFKAAMPGAISTWDGLINAVEESSSKAQMVIKYDPDATTARLQVLGAGDTHYSVGGGYPRMFLCPSNVNAEISRQRETIAHELGHAWGIGDLYKTPGKENFDSLYANKLTAARIKATRSDLNAMRIALGKPRYLNKNNKWQYLKVPNSWATSEWISNAYYGSDKILVDKALAVTFHVNGATIPSSNTTYKVISSRIFTKSPDELFIQTWTYNNAKSTGLPNRSTFDIEKTGHTFVGWGKTANASTGTPDNVNVFHADYVALKPATINSALANGTCSSTLYAIWRTNKLKVQYHANGGTIASSNANYKLTSSLVYKKSDNTVYQQGWEYNLTKPSNGLNNAGSTFGLTRSGYKFVGWGKTASESPKVNGTTVFDDDDFTVTPTKLSSNITTGDRTVTLYAIWKAN